MKLTEEQSRELLRRTGNYLTEACDRCGKPLAEVRWTRRGEPSEWCSQLCRDGETAVVRKRKGGRPIKYRGAKERSKANARYQREFRQRQDVRKTPSQPHRAQGLTDAILASGYHPLSGTGISGKTAEKRNNFEE